MVRKIPYGKVTTYGLVAKYLNIKDNRLIGWAIYKNNNLLIPCHRVVKKDGGLAERYSLGGWKEQKRRLKKEGVAFLNKTHVNLHRYLWRPRLSRLPPEDLANKKIK